MQALQEFIDKNYIYLVVGVSRDRSKWGYRVWKTLKAYGYQAVPVNPKYTEIEGNKCYPSITSLIHDSRFMIRDLVVVTVVPPVVTEKIVEEAVGLGITKIWMQEGSEVGLSVNQLIGESDKLVKIIAGKCIVRDGLGKGFVGQK